MVRAVERDRDTRISRILTVSSFSITSLFAAVLLARHPSAAHGFTLAASIVLAIVCARAPFTLARPLLVLATINLFLMCPEVALRAADFRHDPELDLRLPWPPANEFDPYRLVRDRQLFWKLAPRPAGPPITLGSLTWDGSANHWGFPGREVVIPKSPDVFRILFLGDSCTWQGYPALVEDALAESRTPDGRRFESVSAAVPGYSSYQGRVVAETFGEAIGPDVVVVYFGWNDHWVTHDVTDEQRGRARDSTVGAAVRWSSQLRILHGLVWLRNHVADAASSAAKAPVTFRVPIEDYEGNLRRIKALFDARRTPVIFITAPTAMYRLGGERLLNQGRFFPAHLSLVDTHKQYNEVVRKVASAPGAFLLDLDRSLSARADVGRFFSGDKIHLTPLGLQQIAADITGVLKAQIVAVQ